MLHSSYKDTKKKEAKQDNLLSEEIKCFIRLKQINDAVITQSDKGGKIFIMNKTNYADKVQEKLTKETIYGRSSVTT